MVRGKTGTGSWEVACLQPLLQASSTTVAKGAGGMGRPGSSGKGTTCRSQQTLLLALALHVLAYAMHAYMRVDLSVHCSMLAGTMANPKP